MTESLRQPSPGSHRQQRLDLAARLAIEYTGSVPAGQVLSAVLRTDLTLGSLPRASTRRLSLCEELARHRIVELAIHPRLEAPTL